MPTMVDVVLAACGGPEIEGFLMNLWRCDCKTLVSVAGLSLSTHIAI